MGADRPIWGDKLCTKCAHCSGFTHDCVLPWMDPVDGMLRQLRCIVARGSEWACGAEGREWSYLKATLGEKR